MATIFSNQSVIHYEKRHGVQKERKTSKSTGGMIDEKLLNKKRNNQSNFSDLRKRTDKLSKQMKTFSNALDELEEGLDEASDHIEHWQGIFTYSAGKVYVTETSEYYADLAREERRRKNKVEIKRKSTAVSNRSRARSSRSSAYTCSSDSDSEDDTLRIRKSTKIKSNQGNTKDVLRLPKVHTSVTFKNDPDQKPRPHTSGVLQLDKLQMVNKRLTKPTISSANARISNRISADFTEYNKVRCPSLGYAMTGTLVGSIGELQPGRFRGIQKLSVKGVDSVVERLSNVPPERVPDSNRTMCPRVRAIAGPLNSYAWAGTDRDKSGLKYSHYTKANIYR